MISDVEDKDIKREAKVLFGGTILVDVSLEEMSSYRAEAMGTITTAIVLYLLRLFTQTQHISTATHTCDNDGLVKKVTYLMKQTHTSVLSDPVDADLVLPTAHWGSKMGLKMRWIQGHVERRKPNQEEWTDEEWINVEADELAGRAWTPTLSPLLTPTMNPTNNNIAIRFTQCSLLQVLYKEKSISGNVA